MSLGKVVLFSRFLGVFFGCLAGPLTASAPLQDSFQNLLTGNTNKSRVCASRSERVYSEFERRRDNPAPFFLFVCFFYRAWIFSRSFSRWPHGGRIRKDASRGWRARGKYSGNELSRFCPALRWAGLSQGDQRVRGVKMHKYHFFGGFFYGIVSDNKVFFVLLLVGNPFISELKLCSL